jgi:hypothetical protein
MISKFIRTAQDILDLIEDSLLCDEHISAFAKGHFGIVANLTAKNQIQIGFFVCDDPPETLSWQFMRIDFRQYWLCNLLYKDISHYPSPVHILEYCIRVKNWLSQIPLSDDEVISLHSSLDKFEKEKDGIFYIYFIQDLFQNLKVTSQIRRDICTMLPSSNEIEVQFTILINSRLEGRSGFVH